MALQYEVASLDGLDEGVQALYVENDGKFQLQVEGLDDGAQLKSALASERSLRKDAERQIKIGKDEAADAARQIAEENGNFEQLYKSQVQKNEETSGVLAGLQAGIAKEKTQNAAMKIASELAEGSNVDLLSDFVGRRLQHTDDGVKVLDANGQLTVATVADLQKEFLSDARYSSLLKGNQSSGGGAAGSGNGGGATEKVLSRDQFAGLDPKAQSEHCLAGGTITD